MPLCLTLSNFLVDSDNGINMIFATDSFFEIYLIFKCVCIFVCMYALPHISTVAGRSQRHWILLKLESDMG